MIYKLNNYRSASIFKMDAGRIYVNINVNDKKPHKSALTFMKKKIFFFFFVNAKCSDLKLNIL